MMHRNIHQFIGKVKYNLVTYYGDSDLLSHKEIQLITSFCKTRCSANRVAEVIHLARLEGVKNGNSPKTNTLNK
jgi:hypothetical protein